MALYLALCYYDRDQYWQSPPEMEFSPQYMDFAAAHDPGLGGPAGELHVLGGELYLRR